MIFQFCLQHIWSFLQNHVIDSSMSEKQHLNPEYTLKKTIVMVGMMGAGKTAVGRGLAMRLGVPFLDSDTEIEVAANITVPEIFDRYGEPFFREKETQVIARLLDKASRVLSTGGGAFLSDVNRRNITDHGVSVWLDADLDLLWDRVRQKNTRPLLRTPDPYGALAEIYAARLPFYAKADVVIKSLPGFSIDEMVERVIATLLTERPDVLEKTNA